MSRFEVRKSRNNQFYFVFIAANGETTCKGEEVHNKQDVIDTITAMRGTVPTAQIADVSDRQYRNKRK
jgi:uncharacterized protein YegP (UPF0339 family)